MENKYKHLEQEEAKRFCKELKTLAEAVEGRHIAIKKMLSEVESILE